MNVDDFGLMVSVFLADLLFIFIGSLLVSDALRRMGYDIGLWIIFEIVLGIKFLKDGISVYREEVE